MQCRVSEVGYKPWLANLLSEPFPALPRASRMTDLLGAAEQGHGGAGVQPDLPGPAAQVLTSDGMPLDARNPSLAFCIFFSLRIVLGPLCLTGGSFLRPTLGSSWRPDFHKRAQIPELRTSEQGGSLTSWCNLLSLLYLVGREKLRARVRQ